MGGGGSVVAGARWFRSAALHEAHRPSKVAVVETGGSGWRLGRWLVEPDDALLWLTDEELVTARRHAIRELNLLPLGRPGADVAEQVLRDRIRAIQTVQQDRKRA